jgi:hypothetical protein
VNRWRTSRRTPKYGSGSPAQIVGKVVRADAQQVDRRIVQARMNVRPLPQRTVGVGQLLQRIERISHRGPKFTDTTRTQIAMSKVKFAGRL